MNLIDKILLNQKSNHLSFLMEEVEQDITETEEFKAWFGNSKVVDSSGKPLVVYHGTSGEFEKFKPSESLRQNMFGATRKVKTNAFFFTKSKETAKIFADDRVEFNGGYPKIMSVYVVLKNPIYLTGEKSDRYEVRENKTFDTKDSVYISNDPTDADRLNTKETFNNLSDILGVDLIQLGVAEEESIHPMKTNYVIHKEELLLLLDNSEIVKTLKEKGYDGAMLDEGKQLGESFAVFEPNQIKSVNNKGTFDSGSDNIMESTESNSLESEARKYDSFEEFKAYGFDAILKD